MQFVPRLSNLVVLVAFLLSFGSAYGKSFLGKRIFIVDSYHEGYAWSDGVIQGIKSVLGKTQVEFRVHRMDTKRNKDQAYMIAAGKKAKEAIDKFKPDVVIASDDNAQKYLVTKYLADRSLPVVFCGVNWDESPYGYPFKNITGMVEVALVPQLLKYAEKFGEFDRIGFLAADVNSMRKEVANFKKHFNLKIKDVVVDSMKDWTANYKRMQDEVDILLVGNVVGISDWNEAEARMVVLEYTKILSASVHQNLPHLALVSLAKLPNEQGEWAAKAALKIISGTAPNDIKIVRNRKGALYVNETLAKRLKKKIPSQLKILGEVVRLELSH